MVTDGQSLFWVDPIHQLVKSMALDGGPVVVLAADSAPMALAVDDDQLYWASRVGIRRIAKTGGLVKTLYVAAQADERRGIAVDHESVFFTNWGEYTVRKVPKDGGTCTLLSPNQVLPTGITVAGDFVYWLGGRGLLRIAK
ncbi:MAG: hypothetical protein K1X89_18010 [Myxococcaceae bacterium]|nr:hypothetical protein [Myxococcaceae bacterium]